MAASLQEDIAAGLDRVEVRQKLQRFQQDLVVMSGSVVSLSAHTSLEESHLSDRLVASEESNRALESRLVDLETRLATMQASRSQNVSGTFWSFDCRFDRMATCPSTWTKD